MQQLNFPEQNKAASARSVTGRYTVPLILIVSLFFLWGMANNLNDILIKQFKKAFELSDFQSALVQSAFYFGYFVLAVPASLVMRRYNYKTGIIIGLLLYATGAFLFYPAAEIGSYGFFLLALFIIASGLAFLETAANPYVTALGKPDTATFRLNLAQAFNPIGCVTGILVGQHFIFSGIEHSREALSQMSPEALKAYYASETHAVQLPYLVIGAVILFFALMIGFTKFPEVKDEENTGSISVKNSLKFIFSKRHFSMAVVAQFFYVGAQVCVWSYLIRYTQSTIPGTPEKTAANYLTASLVVFALGRFIGTWLLKKFRDSKLLCFYAMINIGLSVVAIAFPGVAGLYALVAASFFMSIMYPTIFSLGIKNLGAHTKLASSVLVMAIIGGALMTMIMGKISDLTNIATAMMVPMVCFIVIAYYGWSGSKDSQ